MSKIEVSIYSMTPVHIDADPDSFGKVFAQMSDKDQVEVLRAMVKHMKPHQIQWDYIGIELEKPENGDVLRALRQIIPAEVTL